MLPFIEWCEAQDPPIDATNLHEDEIDKYLASKKNRGSNPGGLAMIARHLKAFVRWGQKRRHLNPEIVVTVPKVPEEEPDWLTAEEIARLFMAIDTGETRMIDRDNAMLSLTLDCGGRRDAIHSLDWKDLSWDDERGIGNVMLKEKGDKPPARSHFRSETWNYLKRYRQWCEGKGIPTGPDDPVFVSYRDWRRDPKTGKAQRDPVTGEILRFPPPRLTGQGFHEWIIRLCERTGEDGWWEDSEKLPPVYIRMHGLRHTMGRIWASRYKIPLREVQKAMGHRNIQTTMRYTTPSLAMVADAYAESVNGGDHS